MLVYRVQNDFGAGPYWRTAPTPGPNYGLLKPDGWPWTPRLTRALLSSVRRDQYIIHCCLTLSDLSEEFTPFLREIFGTLGWFPVAIWADRIIAEGMSPYGAPQALAVISRPVHLIAAPLDWSDIDLSTEK
jgi:hypothetical protein